jgi:hypothetical protein
VKRYSYGPQLVAAFTEPVEREQRAERQHVGRAEQQQRVQRQRRGGGL